MAAIYQWVGNILFFLIFMNVAETLLPSKKYEKYIRFFAGMVFILLVIQPLTGSLRIDDRIAYYFENISLKKESQDLTRNILGIEKERLDRILAQYEEAVSQDIEVMVQDLGFSPVKTQVKIESDQEKETYGEVTHITIVLEDKGQRPEGENGQGARSEGGQGAGTENGQGAGTENGQEPGSEAGQRSDSAVTVGQIQIESIVISDQETDSSQVAAASEELEQLRRKVEQYYGLEAKDVEIQLKVR